MGQAELDNELVLQEYVWAGLEASVQEGWRTEFDANQLFYNWFHHLHETNKDIDNKLYDSTA